MKKVLTLILVLMMASCSLESMIEVAIFNSTGSVVEFNGVEHEDGEYFYTSLREAEILCDKYIVNTTIEFIYLIELREGKYSEGIKKDI